MYTHKTHTIYTGVEFHLLFLAFNFTYSIEIWVNNKLNQNACVEKRNTNTDWPLIENDRNEAHQMLKHDNFRNFSI